VVGARFFVWKREFPSLVLVSDFRDEVAQLLFEGLRFPEQDLPARRVRSHRAGSDRGLDLVVAVNARRATIFGNAIRNVCIEVRWYPTEYDPAVFAGLNRRPMSSTKMVVTACSGTVYKTAIPGFS